MKRNSIKLCSLSAAALALLAASPLPAAPAAAANRTAVAGKPDSLADLYPHGRRASDLMGMNLRGSSGENLGHIDDLVVDTTSGQVLYAIVSSGGLLGLGDTLRAVPFSALNYVNDNERAMRVDSDLARWKAAPTYQEDHLQALATDAQARPLFEYYGQDWTAHDSRRGRDRADSSPGSSASSAPFLRRAQTLSDCDVHAGDRDVGHTEDLIVDQSSGKAAILLNPDDAYAGSAKKYVVPFSQFTARTGDEDTLATTLTGQDFASAKTLDGSWKSSGADAAYVWAIDAKGGSDVASGDDRADSASPGDESSRSNAPIEAVRDALQRDDRLRSAASNVTVTAQKNKIVLQGSVPASSLKDQIGDKAKAAAEGWKVDNRLQVSSD